MNYTFTQDLPNHHFRTETPNIIWELGLTPNQFTVYNYVKKITGDGGECFQCLKTIAANTHMSESSVKRSIIVLCQPFSLLEGKPLLRKKEVKSKNGDHQPNLIKVEDIWDINGAHFRSKVSKASQCQDHDTREVGSQRTQVGSQRPTKKNPIKKSSSSLSKDKKETTTFKVGSSFSSLEKLKISAKTKAQLSKEHSQEEVDKAVERVLKWEKRTNDEAAIRTVLERKNEWNDESSMTVKEKNINLTRSIKPRIVKAPVGTTLSLYKSYCEVSNAAWNIAYPIDYEEKDFENKLNSTLLKVGIELSPN